MRPLRGSKRLTKPVLLLPDDFWAAIAPLLPPEASKPKGGRPRVPDRAAQAGISGTEREPVSPHGLRAGFVTQAYQAGLRDEAIMDHTRHRDLATMRRYVRRVRLMDDSPARKLGL